MAFERRGEGGGKDRKGGRKFWHLKEEASSECDEIIPRLEARFGDERDEKSAAAKLLGVTDPTDGRPKERQV